MNDRYPYYQHYVDLTNQRDGVLLGIFLVVLLAFMWLVYCRAWWPRLMPTMRAFLLFVFYATWLALALGVFS